MNSEKICRSEMQNRHLRAVSRERSQPLPGIELFEAISVTESFEEERNQSRESYPRTTTDKTTDSVSPRDESQVCAPEESFLRDRLKPEQTCHFLNSFNDFRIETCENESCIFAVLLGGKLFETGFNGRLPSTGTGHGRQHGPETSWVGAMGIQRKGEPPWKLEL